MKGSCERINSRYSIRRDFTAAHLLEPHKDGLHREPS